jgi:hypothetical protein
VLEQNGQLLCTFSNLDSYQSTIESLLGYYNVVGGKFFVFSNLTINKDVFVTYNIQGKNKHNTFSRFPNTISVHRKKPTNTLYTLNAMNQIIKDENGGVFDKNFSVNWDLYQNSLIITGDPTIKIIPIKLLNIIS